LGLYVRRAAAAQGRGGGGRSRFTWLFCGFAGFGLVGESTLAGADVVYARLTGIIYMLSNTGNNASVAIVSGKPALAQVAKAEGEA
jgi:hypothetical protein